MTAPLPYSAHDLETFSARVFRHYGLGEDHAATAARALVFANLRGLDTHGVARLSGYAGRFERDLVDPRPPMTLETRFGWSASVDGANGMGPVVGQYAMDEALARAEAHGIGVVTARRSNHFGAASFFAVQGVPHGCITMVMSPASRSLAPFGSREPLFGTNPFAVACPAGRHAAWSMDMATSVAARGHIRLAARHGRPIPEGWALDAEGHPTTDAERALEGVMLPFAGAKGSAIAMMIDILGGVLSGSAFGGDIRDMTRDFEEPQDVGHFFLAFKIDAFMPLAAFNGRMETEIARLKALPPAAGHDEVLYPGELEARTATRRWSEGIPISPEVLESLKAVAGRAGVALPVPLASGPATSVS